MGMSDLETYIQAMRKDVTGDVLSRARTMDAVSYTHLTLPTTSRV